MPKTAQKILTTLATVGLVFTPVAAQANTRAGDSKAFYTSSQVQPGLGRSAEGEGVVGESGDIIALILVGLWATGIFVIVADIGDDDNDNQSPGAN